MFPVSLSIVGPKGKSHQSPILFLPNKDAGKDLALINLSMIFSLTENYQCLF